MSTASATTTNNEEEEDNDDINILSTFRNGESVITYFFSNYIVAALLKLQFQLEITVIVIEVVILWLVVYTVLKRYILNNIWSLRKNPAWHQTIKKTAHFLASLGIFIIFQLILSNLDIIWKRGGINTIESAAIIYFLIVLSISLYQTFYQFESK